jgi:phosphoribosylformimino-5-aminoimidazole carboxamide ribotide isomerase
VAGQRHLYRPIQSKLTPSCQPLDVAQAFRDKLHLTEIYLADLDAIGGASPAFPILKELHQASFRLWVDAGVRDLNQARRLFECGIDTLVVGLETIEGPEALARIAEDSPGRVVFSLDLKEGRPLGDLASWRGRDPWSIAKTAIECGVRRILLLDLSRVGNNQGTGTDELATRLLVEDPWVEVTVGGGIRGIVDLLKLQAKGITAALVATALHNLTIQPTHLAQLG